MLYRHFISVYLLLFFFNDPATTEIYTLSLHDALPICSSRPTPAPSSERSLLRIRASVRSRRSEEHTSELQSRRDLVCRLLLEKKKKKHSKIRERLHAYQTNAGLGFLAHMERPAALTVP